MNGRSLCNDSVFQATAQELLLHFVRVRNCRKLNFAIDYLTSQLSNNSIRELIWNSFAMSVNL